MGYNLTNERIQDTFEQLVQISGSKLVDGTGSLITPDINVISSSYAVTSSYSNFAVTASYALNGGAGGTAGDGTGGVGGAGGLGRIELFTPGVGNIDTGSATFANSISPTLLDLNENEFNGDFTSSCGTIEDISKGGGGSRLFILSFLLGLLFTGIVRKSRKVLIEHLS